MEHLIPSPSISAKAGAYGFLLGLVATLRSSQSIIMLLGQIARC